MTGLQKCHLRALYNVSKSASEMAISLGVKCSDQPRVKGCLQLENGNGEVYMLKNGHWVGLTTEYYLDDAACYRVVNHKKVTFVLELFESGFYTTGAAA